MQVTIEAGDFGVLTLLQIEHSAFEHLWQCLATAHHQQRLLEAQGLDHARLHTAWQT
ncbi:hypothetical protein D3C72_2368440 [compost metagenome]